jgi:two-component system sensor histidine kinase YesM
MITLEEEIDYVMNYITIQKLRFSKAINITYTICDNCMNLAVPKLILQPIVENSIIYGMEDMQHDLNININALIKEEYLIIEVSDDGPGMEEETLKNIFANASDRGRFSKVGLNNVNQRIKLYYGSEFGLEIETEPGAGTKVIVNLPVNPI